MHELKFDSNRLDARQKEAVENLQRNAGVDPNSLINAAKAGDFKTVAQLAAGADHVSLTADEIAMIIPNFGKSEPPEVVTVARGEPQRTIPSRFTETLPSYKLESRKIASDDQKPEPSFKEGLGNFDRSQFFGALGNQSEFGDSETTLFQRVRKKYRQRLKALR